MDLSLPRIICAAVQNKDGRITCGPRHFDGTMWAQILGITLEEFSNIQRDPAGSVPITVKIWQGAEEGFIDQYGKFYTREEAWPIALENEQINPQEFMWQTGKLHSEHLY